MIKKLEQTATPARTRQHLHILDTALSFWSARSTRWFQPRANELLQMDPVSQTVDEVFSNDVLYDAVEACYTEGEEFRFEFEWGQQPKLSILATITPMQKTSAQRGRMIMTLQDLTTQRQTEQVRADFVANVSHELRTPLSTLVASRPCRGRPRTKRP